MSNKRKAVLVLSALLICSMIGLYGYIQAQTQDLCVTASEIIKKNGSLDEIKSEAAKYQFKPSGNGISQVLFFKLSTVSGLCIVTLENGKPIDAQYHHSP
ncbi:hypothetical protein VT25_19370 [Photobacterium leiognathi subsp. mandapamensis]|nr:hypothetical protein VT25_19370 [Photobacterium leiognathi subsp. mandapamensis]